MPAPYLDMHGLRSISFTEALRRLHELIGSQVQVTVNFHGRFFGCGMTGKLLRIEFLPPDHAAISVVLEGGHGVCLDPDDAEVFAGEGEDGDFIEFQTAYGVSLVVEAPRLQSDE